MMNLLKKIIIKKYDIIYPAVLNIIFLIIMFLSNNIFYETIDDYMIQEICAGYYGEYNQYIIQMNVLIGKFLVYLFKIVTNVNWYFLFLIVLQFISFTTIGSYIIKIKGKKLGSIIYITILIPFYFVGLCNLQYTQVAYTLLTAGMIVQIYSVENKYKKDLLYSGILIILGTMIRFNCYYTYLIYLVTYLFIKIINKEKLKNIIIVNFVIGLCVIIIQNFSINYYNNNLIYKKYFEYSKIRVLHNDFCDIDYNENKDIFKNVGWSENDKKLLDLVTIADEDVFSKDNLETIYKTYISEKEMIKFNDTVSKNFIFIFEIKILIPLCMCIILIILDRNRKNKIIILAVCIVQELIYMIINKCPIRVIYPTCFIAYILIILDFKFDLKEFKEKTTKKYIIFKIIMIYLLITNLVCNFIKMQYRKSLNEESYIYNQLYEYVSENKENAYIYPTYSLQYRYINTANLSVLPKGKIENLFPIGSWMIYNKEYNEFLKKYEIENMFKALIEKENVYLVDSNTYYLKGNISEIVTFLNEHYYNNQAIKVNEIKNFDNKIYIYKLESKEQ